MMIIALARSSLKMKHGSISVYLSATVCTLYLSILGIDGSKNLCKNEICKFINKYVERAKHPSPKLCTEPYSRFCSLLEKRQKTLTQEKYDQATVRRENIFDDAFKFYWAEDPLGRAYQLKHENSRCRETLNDPNSRSKRDSIVANVTRHLKERNESMNKFPGIVHFKPIFEKTEEEIEDQVKNMTNKQLCFYEMEGREQIIIDRIYVKIYLQNVSIPEAEELINLYRIGLLKILKGVISCPRCDELLESMKLKIGFPEAINDTGMMRAVYPEGTENIDTKSTERQPQPAWALPLYPEAAWYNEAENALCEYRLAE